MHEMSKELRTPELEISKILKSTFYLSSISHHHGYNNVSGCTAHISLSEPSKIKENVEWMY